MEMVDWKALDTSMAPPGYRELRTDHVLVELRDVAYFELTGRDHREWLQGQATNDVRLIEDQPWLDFCLTKPTGQIAAVCRAWVFGTGLLIATEQPDVLLARTEETVILEDVSLTRHAGELVCVQGIETKRVEGAFFSDRTGSGGVERPPLEKNQIAHLSPEAYELATLEAGIPLVGVDYSERTLPPELGPNFESNHVSYTKGCYVGQEVLMRIKARGHTNKTWVGLKVAAPVAPGAPVTFEGREVGTVHRSAHSPLFGHIASATLRNEATAPGTMVSAAGAEAEVVEMPFLR